MNLDRFLTWADRRNIVAVRTVVLAVTVWMTWRVTVWAFELTKLWMISDKSGVDTAAVIAAVSVPFTALQTYAFKLYMEEKK